MIYIVHGENLVKARARILNQQKKLQVRYRQELNIQEITPSELISKIGSVDIFGEQQFFVINITGSGRSNLDEYIEIFLKTPKQTTVVILSEKRLAATNVFIKNAKLLNAQVFEDEAEFQSNVFGFVDAVIGKNRTKAYRLLHDELDNDKDPFELFAMLCYGLRSLSQAKFGTKSFKAMKPFRQEKTLGFSSKYSEKEIKNDFKYFYELDMKAKTGEVSPDIMLTLAMEKMLHS